MNEEILGIINKALALLHRELLYRETYIILRENNQNINYYPTGWGNGYVALPKGHPLYGEGYDEIHNICDINVHGGLTYSQMEGDKWVVGFDTCHGGDTLENWPKSAVKAETESLKEQLSYIDYQLPF